jgi:hypothetical protein
MKAGPVFGKVSVQSHRERQRWRRQEHVKKDLQQTVFQSEASDVLIKGNPHKFATVTEKGIDPFKSTTCPFCLSYSKLRLFLISTSKGFDRGRGKCPVCGQGMKLQTLVKMEKWTPQEYAKFVFDYRSQGFWQKIKFETWSKHLKMMNWTQPFWDEYKRLKDDLPDAEGQRAAEDKWSDYEGSFK